MGDVKKETVSAERLRELLEAVVLRRSSTPAIEEWQFFCEVQSALTELLTLRQPDTPASIPGGVGVKPLEWKQAFWNKSDPDYEHIVEIWEAFGAGHIQGWVEQQKDGKFYTEGEQFETLDAAKAAVQGKHERIVLSALKENAL